MQVQIYDAEIKDGLGEQLRNNKVSIASSIKPLEVSEEVKIALAAANPNQKDLYYKHAILASVGWNQNDDVFEKEESWYARNSIKDKKLDLNHNELDIVGHITDSFVYDENGNIIPDNTPIENVPDKFDIVNQFVVYSMWTDAAKQKEINDIISEIENNEWFVSMECFFPNFDYALQSSSGETKIVERSKDTAFLTKYLRAYNGSGEYKEYKIGRLLRDFFFSGQGIVKVPANKRSIIFDDAKIKNFKSQGSLIIKENKMDEKQVAELVAKLEKAEAQIKALESQETSKQIESLNKALETAKAEVTAANEKVAASTKAIAEKDEAIANLTEEVKGATEKLSEMEAQAKKMAMEQKKVARCSKLATAGVPEAEVEAEFTKWENLTDEQFDKVAEMYAAKNSASKKEIVTETAVVEEAVIEEKPALAQTQAGSNDLAAQLGEVLRVKLPFSAAAAKRKAQ